MTPYVHRCVVREGPAAGNKAAQVVTAGSFLYNNECEFCGEKMATLEDIVLHIYEELVDDPEDL